MKKEDLKGKELTDKAVNALEAIGKTYRIKDRDNLYLCVRASGSKSWEWRYRKNDGKYSWMGLGSYPDVTLKEARTKALDAANYAKQGTTAVKNQRQQEAEERAARTDTVRALLHEWKERKAKSVTPVTLRRNWLAIERHVLPVMGDNPIASIQPAYIRKFFEGLEHIGETSTKIRRALTEAFDAAKFDGRIQDNPIRGVDKFLKRHKGKNFPHVSQEELPQLIRDIDGYPRSPQVRHALLLLALNGWRPAMLRLLEWTDIDVDTATVTIPAERMKGGIDYIAPLSSLSLQLLEDQREISGAYRLAFPNRNDPRKPMSDGAMSKGLDYLGYKGRQVPHGFRHVLSTGLSERGYDDNVIEAQTAHKKDGIKGVYNKARHMEQRRPMMNAWAKEIRAMMDNRENVVAINRA